MSALWTLSETRKHCLDTITEEYRGGLDDCKAYCEKNGATRLAFSSNNYCRCCTASSKLSFHFTSQMYTLKGKYIYAPTTNCLPIAQYFKKNQYWLIIKSKSENLNYACIYSIISTATVTSNSKDRYILDINN